VERLGFRVHRRLDRLGRTSPIRGAVLGAVLGIMMVWILGIVAIEIGSLRSDVRKSAILRRLDAVLTPPGPRLTPVVVCSDPFSTVRGLAPATGPTEPIVTHAPGVLAATWSTPVRA
jgi:hypothetical protein